MVFTIQVSGYVNNSVLLRQKSRGIQLRSILDPIPGYCSCLVPGASKYKYYIGFRWYSKNYKILVGRLFVIQKITYIENRDKDISKCVREGVSQSDNFLFN